MLPCICVYQTVRIENEDDTLSYERSCATSSCDSNGEKCEEANGKRVRNNFPYPIINKQIAYMLVKFIP